MPFELFRRPRAPRQRGGGPSVLVDRRRNSIALDREAVALLGENVAAVVLAADEDEQAIALIPTRADNINGYRLTRTSSGARVAALSFLRVYAVASGRYRAESTRVFGSRALGLHYVRIDRITTRRTS